MPILLLNSINLYQDINKKLKSQVIFENYLVHIVNKAKQKNFHEQPSSKSNLKYLELVFKIKPFYLNISNPGHSITDFQFFN